MKSAMTLAAAVVLAIGNPAVFAATGGSGTGAGGLGFTSHVSSSAGPTTEGTTSTGLVGAIHSGSIGTGTGHVAGNVGVSTDGRYATGGGKAMTGGVGRGTDHATSKVYNVPMVGGMGGSASVSGG